MIHSTRGRASQQTGLAHGRNPATGQVIYSDAEVEWLKAIQRLKKQCPHPTWEQVFALFLSLGYRKVSEPPQ